MAQHTGFFRAVIAILAGLAMFFSVDIGSAKGHLEEPADVFVNKSTAIAAGQTIGKLMVAGGDAYISGNVTDGIIIVDGNGMIESGAMVSGRIIVLGGNVNIDQGASIEERPWVIAPKGHPLVPVLVMTLFLLGAASLVMLPILFWLIGHFFKKTQWYPAVREQFLMLERRWPVLYIVTGLLLSALMLLAFITLAWETLFRNAMSLFDDSFVWLIRYFANPVLDKVMIGISDIGFGTSYIVIVGTAFFTLACLRRWREIGAMSICLTGGAVLSYLLKNLFHRARPDLFRVVQETGFSFPSGHALATMCFYGMAAFLIMRTIDSWRGRLTVMTLTVIMGMSVGISRIYLGVHYPTDVIAGYAAGSMWLAFCIALLMWWERVRVK